MDIDNKFQNICLVDQGPYIQISRKPGHGALAQETEMTMEPILFYGVPEGCSFGTIVALEWLGKPYRLCRIEMPGIVSSEAYKRLNPVGETPSMMTEESAVLSESMAILNHLGARGLDSGLAFPQGSVEFDRLNQMLAFLNTSFFNAFTPFWHVVEHDSEGVERQALMDFGRGKVEQAHADLEAMLNGHDWLLGKERSLADAYFAGIARWNEFHGVLDMTGYPGLHRLRERLDRDPGVRFAHAIEQGKTATSSGGFLGHVSLEAVLAQAA